MHNDLFTDTDEGQNKVREMLAEINHQIGVMSMLHGHVVYIYTDNGSIHDRVTNK